MTNSLGAALFTALIHTGVKRNHVHFEGVVRASNTLGWLVERVEARGGVSQQFTSLGVVLPKELEKFTVTSDCKREA